MKKEHSLRFVAMVFMAILVWTMAPQNVQAQASQKNLKQEEKQSGKNFKEKVKELEKGGWKIAGDYRTLELAIIEHQNQIDENSAKYYSVTGEVNKCRSIDACKQAVLFQVQRELAEEISSDIEGIGTQLLNLDLASGDEINNLINTTVRYTKADVSGLFTPSYSIIKDNSDGTKSFRTFFIVDLAKRSAIQLSALEKAAKETKLSIEQSEAIQKFVRKTLDSKK